MQHAHIAYQWFLRSVLRIAGLRCATVASLESMLSLQPFSMPSPRISNGHLTPQVSAKAPPRVFRSSKELACI